MRSSPPNASRFGDPQLTDGVYLTLSAVMALVTAPSLVLNATVIIVTLRHKKLRQPLNVALVNMAVADLGAAMTGGVLGVVYNAWPGHPPLGRTACVVEGFAVSVFGITSLCTVALIAMERMFVVCKPLGQFNFQMKHAAVGVALSWLWSLGWNLPPLFGWGRYELEGVGTSCAPDWHSRDPSTVSYILCYLCLCFAMPFALILASYGKLLWTLHQVSRKVCLEGGASARAESKVARMVVLMVLCFLTGWLPYAGMAMVVVYCPDVHISPLVATLPVYLAKSSTLFNPLVYIFLNKQFRQYAVPFLLCGRQPWVEEEDVSETQTVVE
ncbi:unnamed protein product [Boreogadus saida]